MQKKLISLFLALLFIFIPSLSKSQLYNELTNEVCLTEEEYNIIVQRLLKDKKIIEDDQKRFDALRIAIPQISYKIIDNGVVIQKILIPMPGDTSIEYENTFEILIKKPKEHFFPFTLMLVGGVETRSFADAKLGVEVFSLSPLTIKFLREISFNVLVGFQSTDVSISYSLPKPLSNISIHLYYGLKYEKSIPYVFGIGIGLNF